MKFIQFHLVLLEYFWRNYLELEEESPPLGGGGGGPLGGWPFGGGGGPRPPSGFALH